MQTAAPIRRRLTALVLLVCLLLTALLPRASAASLQNLYGIQVLSFDSGQILSIGNQAPGQCSLYALRYARTILDGTTCSGAGMWSNGAVWSAGGYTGFSGNLSACLSKIYTELAAGRPVIVHLKNTTVSGVSKHTNRTSTEEYPTSPPATPTATGSVWWAMIPRPTPPASRRATFSPWTRPGFRRAAPWP